jgi:hypothetical protein
MMRILMVATLLALALATPAAARTWLILPDGTGDAPTIQAGIDSTVAGDTVLVASGQYDESNITVKSAIVLIGASSPDSVSIVLNADDQDFHGLICEGLANVTVANLTIDGHNASSTATGGGAGIYATDSQILIRNCRITRCISEGGPGGALHLRNCSVTLEDCVIDQNDSNYHEGGGLFCIESDVVIVGSQFISNEAGDVVGPREGGGIAAIRCRLSLENCEFRANKTTGSTAGAILFREFQIPLGQTLFSSDSLMAVGCQFLNNSARYGGGGVDCSGPATFRNCVFDGNVSGRGAGGALRVSNDFTIEQCLFVANRVGGEDSIEGAAIAVDVGATQVIRESIFSGNGGENTESTMVLRSDSNVHIESCTLTQNPASAAVVALCAGASATFQQCLFWNNDAPSDLIVASGGSATFQCGIVDTSRISGDGIVLIADSFLADPLFCSAGTDDFSVAENVSPCLPWNSPCGLLIGALAAGCNDYCPSAATRYVPSQSYGTIGEALIASSPGDTIGVCIGEYREAIILQSGVHLLQWLRLSL